MTDVPLFFSFSVTKGKLELFIQRQIDRTVLVVNRGGVVSHTRTEMMIFTQFIERKGQVFV